MGGQLESLGITLNNLVETVNKEYQNINATNKTIPINILKQDQHKAQKNSKNKNESVEDNRKLAKSKVGSFIKLIFLYVNMFN